LPDYLFGEFCERDASDVDGGSVGQFNICGLERRWLRWNWNVRGYGDSSDGGHSNI
jgi:hypothetical protein